MQALETFPWPATPESAAPPTWKGDFFSCGGRASRVLAYEARESNWSEDLTRMHEALAGRGHPMSLASWSLATESMRRLPDDPSTVVLDVGCSSGFVLEDLRRVLPRAGLIGADYLPGPLGALGDRLAGVPLLQFDLRQCPLLDACLDGVTCLNVLEHIDDDRKALGHIHRILKPGGIAHIEVPAGPGLYGTYDRYLGHHRRYRARDLAAMARSLGFGIERLTHIGFLVFPAFWAAKKRDRLRGPRADAEEGWIVMREMRATRDSRILGALTRLELAASRRLSYPWGIRAVAVLRKPEARSSCWPKRIPTLSPEQQRISDDFVKHWHEVLPKRFRAVERFNHLFPVSHSRPGFRTTLEIGAGLGEHIAHEKLTAEQRLNYHALELRENMAEQLRRNFPWVNTIVGDCQERTGFRDGYFDRVIAVHVLEHLPMLPGCVRECHRLLDKERGQMLVVIPTEGSPAYTLARKISAERIFRRRYGCDYRWFRQREHINRPAEVLRELESHFTVETRRFFPLPFLPLEACNLFIAYSLRPRPVPLETGSHEP